MTVHLDHEKDLLPLAAGFLDDAQEKRVRDHLAGCAACRQHWDDLRDGREVATDATRHLPAAMIARWDGARANLRGLERVLVREHLARCETCRDELRALGHQPEMPLAAVTPLTSVRPSHRRDGTLFAAGVTVAAIAAAVVLVLGLGPGSGVPETGPDGVLPWVAPRLLRGDRAETVVLAPEARSISLLINVPLEADPERAATLDVRAPDGTVIWHGDLATADLARGTLVVVLDHPEPLPGGAYAVVFRQPAAPGGLDLVEQTVFAVRHGGQ